MRLRSINIPLTLLVLFTFFACWDQRKVTIEFPSQTCKTHGRVIAQGTIPKARDVAIDAYCAEKIIKRYAPDGVITIFGSSRAKKTTASYRMMMDFASQWTGKHGKDYPILTGGGPGLMEAANKGAADAGGKSLAFGSYFGAGDDGFNDYVSAGYIFTSFAQRESDMVDHAVAIVVGPGGIGTEWEIFEAMAKIQTGKKDSIPIILLGKKSSWKTLFDRLNYFKQTGTISAKNIKLVTVAESVEGAITIIEKHLYKK